jgi:hypothetical protein
MRKKIIGIFIIGMLIEFCVGSSISEDIEEKQKEKFTEDFFDAVYTSPNDKLDQYQTRNDAGLFFWQGDYAQSFKPELNILTRVQVYVSGTQFVNLTISIRNSLFGNNLVSKTSALSDFPSIEMSWREFDFPDLFVSPNREYFIVINATLYAGPTKVCSISFNNPYDRGMAYFLGRPVPDKDFCFKTYGHSENFPAIKIDDINVDIGISAEIRNNWKAPTYNVFWSIDVKPQFLSLVIFGDYSENVINKIDVNKIESIHSYHLWGIGWITITVQAGDTSKKATGLLFGPLVLNLKEI